MKRGLLFAVLIVILLFISCVLEPKHEHTFSTEWSSDANYHWHAATCEHINQTKNKAAHTWDAGVITTEATHTTNGVITFTCTVCGYQKTAAIPALADAHTFAEEWNNDESHHWHVATCVHTDVKGSYAEHIWNAGQIITEATHTSDGIINYTCTICGRTKTEAIPASIDKHSFSTEWVHNETHHWHEATCEHADIKGSYEEHIWDNSVISKQPTCSEPGTLLYTCKCGAIIEVIIQAQHSFSDEWTSDETHHWHVATCEHSDQVSQKEEHSWDDGRITVEPTHLEDGIATYTCTVCGKQKTDTIPKTGKHTYSSEWEHDDTYHWHPATCGHTELKSQKAVHSFDANNRCTVCGYESIDYMFKITSDGILTVNSQFKSKLPSVVIIPSTVSEVAVKTIGSNAFKDIQNITNVIIPSSVENIENSAFEGCTALSSITIPSSVICIGNNVFKNCKQLSEISIPCSVTSFGWGNFIGWGSDQKITITYGGFTGSSSTWSSCSAKVIVTIPEGTTSISNAAFEYCTGLSGIIIPDFVTSIGNDAFNGCTSLTEITIPNSITNIGSYAFKGCSSLMEINIPSSVTTLRGRAFSGWTSDQTIIINYGGFSSDSYTWKESSAKIKVTLPEGTTTINRSAFSNWTGLTEITIPDSVTAIESYAFQGCTSLIEVTIPDSVTSIGQDAFDNCTNLKSLKLPEFITTIPSSMCSGCVNLMSIKIPDSVTRIEWYAFSGCSSLKEVTFGGNISFISSDAFYNCTSSISFTEGTTTIPAWVGDRFKGVTALNIPASVSTINTNLFYDYRIGLHKEMSTITVSPDNQYYSAENGILFNKDKTVLIRWPSACGTITIPDSVTEIKQGAFAHSTDIDSVIIPPSVKTIGENAFYECPCSIVFADGWAEIPEKALYKASMIKGVTLPNSVTSIGDSAFYGCSSLESLAIGNSIVHIGWYAFSGANLPNLVLPKTATDIKPDVFARATGSVIFEDGWNNIEYYIMRDSLVSSITIPDSATNIDENAFNGCLNLTDLRIGEENPNYSSLGGMFLNKDKSVLYSWTGATGNVEIPDSVTRIRNRAFYKSNITGVVIPNTVTSIEAETFSYCRNLTSVSIPTSVTSIGYDAFCCTGLTCLTIPDSVITIDSGAFKGCSNLTSVIIPSSVTTLGLSVFATCENLESVHIPSSVVSIGSGLFCDSYNLKEINYGGTKAQWNSIAKVDWDSRISSNVRYIHCTDGNISL